ncbi:MAG: hypothetical protein WBM50_24175, partial [Acidimicrobiales bacterium]
MIESTSSNHRRSSTGSTMRRRSARQLAGDADLVIAGFGGWTLFVWGGRLRNLWIEPGGLGAAGRWSLLGAVGFTALG